MLIICLSTIQALIYNIFDFDRVMANGVERKRCHVCDDYARCYNFGGFSCESCKAFFRRNASNYKKIKCLLDGNCIVDKRTRKYCPRCRLEKCVSIGMKTEFMLIELRKPRKSSPPVKVETKITDSTNNSNIHLLSIKPYDLSLIEEIQNASSAFQDETSLEVVGQVETVLQAANLAELFVRRTIKFCHKFDKFTSLNPSDQLILLKHSHSEMIAIYSSFLYDEELDGFLAMHDESEKTTVALNLEKLSNQLKNKAAVDVYRNFAFEMHQEMENDTLIRDLIMTQLLFKPRDNLSCSEFIRYTHIVYCNLLRRYFTHKYSDSAKADLKYESLMAILEQLGEICSIIRQIYISELEPGQISQVLAEIYNLL